MKKSWIVLTVLLLANGILSMDGIELLKSLGWVDVVSVTPTGLVIKYRSIRFQEGLKDGRYFGRLEPYEEELILTPSQQTQISGGRDSPNVRFTPVSFKGQQKGFRVMKTFIGAHSISPPDITYIVLSDTPMELGEGDVEMVMDKGEWVRAEDSKSLELEKLGWEAECMIGDADYVMQNPQAMTNLLSNPGGVRLWNLLVDKGLIKHPKLEALREEDRGIDPRMKRLLAWEWNQGHLNPKMLAIRLEDPSFARLWHATVAEGLINTNIEPKSVTVFERAGDAEPSSASRAENRDDEQSEAQPKPNRLWLYAGILFCALSAILLILYKRRR